MTIAVLVNRLLAMQNPDGGWAYGVGSSWTEPTAFAVLALRSARSSAEPLSRAYSWLKMMQREDGGWPPTLHVLQSTCVTSAAVLACSGSASLEEQTRKGSLWILRQTSARESLITDLLRVMFNQPRPTSVTGGAPWFPGTAPWVAPTAMKILALSTAFEKSRSFTNLRELQAAQQFLIDRRLADGGWNHGGAYTPGEAVCSYPETTGLALLALKGAAGDRVGPSVKLAQSYLSNPNSLEAWSWLTMALRTHGAPTCPPGENLEARTSRDLALAILALTAADQENLLTREIHV